MMLSQLYAMHVHAAQRGDGLRNEFFRHLGRQAPVVLAPAVGANTPVLPQRASEGAAAGYSGEVEPSSAQSRIFTC